MTPEFETHTSINGRFVTRDEAKVSVFDNAFLYAEGLFETFLAVGDRIIFVPGHLKRLHDGAALTRMTIPVSDETLVEWIVGMARRHLAPVKQIRLTITSGEAARWTGLPGEPQVVISAAPHTLPRKPFRLLTAPFRVDQESVFRRIKTTSYAIHAAALREAKLKGFDDALLLNEVGNVAEVSSANIFWVHDKSVFTPPLTAGCLEGVTRANVMKAAAELGYGVEEANTTLSALSDTADEVFISSSLKLVVGVALIEEAGSAIEFAAGPITHQLTEYFWNLVGAPR